jgi:hypothetical protein
MLLFSSYISIFLCKVYKITLLATMRCCGEALQLFQQVKA